MKYTLKNIDKMTCEELAQQLGVKVENLITNSETGTIEIHTAETDKSATFEATKASLSSVSGMVLTKTEQ